MNSDEIVAQFKFTVLLMPNGPQKITGISLDPTAFQTENCITDEEIKKLITSSTRNKPNKKKKPATDGNKVSPIGCLWCWSREPGWTLFILFYFFFLPAPQEATAN